MKSIERITQLVALVALAQACTPDKGLVSPRTSKPLVADVEEQPEFSDWSAPVNLGPVVNSAYNDQHPSISKDGLSLYFVSNRPGGFDPARHAGRPVGIAAQPGTGDQYEQQ